MRSIVTLICFVCLVHGAFSQEAYNKEWTRVYKFEVSFLPQSALKVVDEIYARAKREQNIPQLTKALLYQSKFALTQPDAELAIIDKWKKEITQAKAPLKNILESILANLYWQYFQDKRWTFYDRTRTEGVVNEKDFRTWDAEAMFREISLHFEWSLVDVATLKSINLNTIDEILTDAENSRLYRPTLFDFIAHEALDFYSTNEGDLDRFDEEIDLNDPRQFENIELVLFPTNSLSPTVRAIKLYKDLLAFHANDADPSAYVNLQIEWIRFLENHGSFENERGLMQQALTHLRMKYQHHVASAQGSFELANMLYEEGLLYKPKVNTEPQYKKRESLVLCEDVIKSFPNSDGAEKCKVLRDNILNRKLSLEAEEFIPIQTHSRIKVEYTNVDSLYFSAYSVTDAFDEILFHRESDSTRAVTLSNLAVAKQWAIALRNLSDYQEHATEIIVPPLAIGKYIITCTDGRFVSDKTTLSAVTSMQVTNLALLEASFEDVHRYQVVDRNTGKPLAGADVHIRSLGQDDTHGPIDEQLKSDRYGFLEIKRPKKYGSWFEATVTYKDDRAKFGEYRMYQSYERNDRDVQVNAKAFLFTDRSIYRPGQTVYFKGILIKTKGKQSSVVAGQYVDVYIEDVNGQEIGDQRLKTNQYGSFSGEFKLHDTGLTGEYTLYADEDSEESSLFYDNLGYFEESIATIMVEEYKRPTFEVSFKPVSGEYNVNDSVTVTGNAIAFSSAKIGKATVSYYVKRTVRYPRWFYWSDEPDYGEEEEIDSGEGVTNPDGTFSITFPALPDEKVSKESLPIFNFDITADITDVNGETRSATTSVKIGYHSLLATLQVPEKINNNAVENSIGVAVENLNGQPVPTAGAIQIYKVKTPFKPVRPRVWEAPDLQMISEEEFSSLFPHELYESKETGQPQKGKLMKEVAFNTAASKEVKWRMDKTWQPGSYLVELRAKDKNGNDVIDFAQFTVVDLLQETVADNKTFLVEMDKTVYNPGDIARIKIGSASADMTITVDVEKKYKSAKTYVEHFSGNSKELSIPITADMEGGFAIHVGGVNYNSFFKETKNIQVLVPYQKVEIETITFKDKLQPGSRQTWSFEIKGDNQPLLEAEMLASMYDASLDQFNPHQWDFRPIWTNNYYGNFRALSGDGSFGTDHFNVSNVQALYYSYPQQYYDQLDWFGFSISNNVHVKDQYHQRLYSTGMASGSPSKITSSTNKKLRKGLISGRITSMEDGSPLPGVNVIVKGTTRGTATDAGGRYILDAGKNEILVFSFIGLSSIESKIGNRNVIDVSLALDITQLSEVVVTALGISVEKKSLGYSVSQILSDQRTEIGVEFAMSGRVDGVQVTGIPGGTVNLMIKGASKLAEDNYPPLYIVDGVIVKSYTIDQADLGNVQVLKGEAATALYGSKAASGVIIITTKSGQKKLDEAMAKVNARKDFKETAFFFPHLTADPTGTIRFTFTTPESLTRWKLQLLAHTKELNSAYKMLQSVTQKELMVTPNAPRFLRMGDEIIVSAKISNLTAKSKSGNAALQLSNAVTGESIDALLGNVVRNQPFKVAAKGSTEVSWKLKIPAGVDAVQYKVIAKAGSYSDGEQNVLPVLSNRTLVTETMPMYVRGNETKTFHFNALQNTRSATLQHHQLTLEVSSNPAWYAVQALPYLMEFPYECAEQLFSRYYANALANHILNRRPAIKAVFEEWNSSDALISELEKNQELKTIIIQETPWLRDAQRETEQKKRIAMLFDLNKVANQMETVIPKLQELQLANGGFTWFTGGADPSRYITQHVASGFGHLQQLGATMGTEAIAIQQKAVSFLDNEILKDYNQVIEQATKLRVNAKSNAEGATLYKEFMDRQQISSIQVQYLYMRSFYPNLPIGATALPAVEYYRKQSATYWTNFNLYMKGMIALVHHRLENKTFPKQILLSLKENSIQSDEMGMYWKENKSGWYWYESPIETQALMIEAFAEIDYTDEQSKQQTLDNLRIWLLKNKQTNQWKTTKATTEAVYSLLMTGTDWLNVKNQLDVTVASKKVESGNKPEAGTGYFKTSWKGEAITPGMSEVTLTSKDKTIGWAGMYWQYFEDLDKITGTETPLKLSKKVFLVRRDDKGEILTEINSHTPVVIGSLLRIRIELQADRPMEFLHMKDMRASGLEPVDVLSGYKNQEGLWYYQSTKDASTNFFFDSISTGVYVFEYDLRANNKGDFSNGITTIQCMYAPEFSSHSEGIRIQIK